MQPEDVQQVIGTLRQQLGSLTQEVAAARSARIAAFEQDKPQLRQLIQVRRLGHVLCSQLLTRRLRVHACSCASSLGQQPTERGAAACRRPWRAAGACWSRS